MGFDYYLLMTIVLGFFCVCLFLAVKLDVLLGGLSKLDDPVSGMCRIVSLYSIDAIFDLNYEAFLFG